MKKVLDKRGKIRYNWYEWSFFYKKGRSTPETLSLVLGSLTLYLYYTMDCNKCQYFF
uniref:Uncharacterized protein n=1 Tax=Staphylococcus phage 184DA TaxID=3110532 RepID=A0AAU6MXQ7_9CAUD